MTDKGSTQIDLEEGETGVCARLGALAPNESKLYIGVLCGRFGAPGWEVKWILNLVINA